MEYHEAANFLFDLRRYSPRTGVEETRDLLAHLGDPHEGLRVVQVAGSNGKGSTARMVERVCREAGLDVGLYTSPHLSDLRERVRVNGRKAPKSAVTKYVSEIDDYVTDRAAENASPTFFEGVTAFALWEFARQDVDLAVLEVGIGGRYDATSVCDPVASAVTSVTLEHSDILGETVEEIAYDKAHVVGEHPLVTAATGGALDSIREVAGEVVRVGKDADTDVRVSYEGREGLESVVHIETADWAVEAHLPLLGEHQARNAGVAAALCVQVLDSGFDTETLARGLRNAHFPGRFEVMRQSPLVVLDGAHNPGGSAALGDLLAGFDYDDLHVVFGAMCDKDHAGMVDGLPAVDYAYTCRPALDRAESSAALARVFESRAGSVTKMGNVAGALDAALDAAGEDDCVLVTGSLFTVAEARERWTRVDIAKRVPDLDTARAVLEDADVTAPGVWRMRGKGVHRVVKTTVQPRQAEYLKQEMLSVGGECATSGLSQQDREDIDVVLMGTLAQFKRLLSKLEGQPYGLEQLGARLKRTLGIQHTPETHGYPWEDGTAIMGILNVTPDSFHDGGEYDALEDAVARAETMVANGAAIIDVGGESTRPGADVVPVEEEIDRVVPVIEAIADLDVLVSVDTRKAAVARAALDAGADILNDVSGLEDPEMRLVAAEYDVPVVVMHSIEAPVDPSTEIEYDDVVEDTIDALTERVLLAEKAGLDRSQIIVDPGIGFGKTPGESFELLSRVDEFHALGCPVLVGHSHKSMFGAIGYEPGERLHATVGASALAAERGADIIRVHDVAENAAAVHTVAAVNDPPEE
ncbi:dihydropteroate synthase [Natronomonas sp. EA1]|uniref:dihydropteroate synthase n=1 Tax=Natronomonas sp. EA1 TaxID=3421655 RepID=UPI003EBB4B94